MKKSDKEEVKSLWKKCFNDSDEFIDLYFRRRYYDDINMALFYDDKLISALQMIPYEMTFYGEKIRASYISGAATDPDYRNRGAMAQLLKDSHQRMYKKGVSLSFLIPAGDGLFDYYSKFGYETIFFSKFIKGGNLALDKDFSLQVELCEEVDEYIYNYLYDRMLALPSAVLHNYEDLSIVMDDIKLAGGKIVKASRNDSICGVSFAVPVEKDVIIKAIIADSGAIKDAMFSKLLNYFNADSTVYRTFQGDDLLPYGMARVINVDSLLSLWAKANSDRTICINLLGDIGIPQNNGLYIITNGKCYHYDNRFMAHQSGNEEVIKALDRVEEYNINSVVKLLFENLNPYISLMMD